MAKRPRLDSELCDYCYHERLQQGRAVSQLKDLSSIPCVCSPNIGCKSTVCAYGSSIGGKGGHTSATRKKQHQSST